MNDKVNYLKHNYTMDELQIAINQLDDKQRNLIYSNYQLSQLLALLNDDGVYSNCILGWTKILNEYLQMVHAVQEIKSKLDKGQE